MSNTLKLKLKIGEIEFEAEGPVEAVEQQREIFVNGVLPAAVNAMAQTRTSIESKAYIESTPQAPMLESDTSEVTSQISESSVIDYSRTNLPSFLKSRGALNDQDFTLFAAYFDEKKNGTKAFSIENVKLYYAEARRQAYSNNSELVRQLARKGYIMDTETPEGAKPGKHYMLTQEGIAYVEGYAPKEASEEKKKVRTKSKKSSASYDGTYASINADDLNLKEYPAVKSLSGSKEQIIMAMFIVTNEKKGEWFTVDDLIYLLVNVFEVSTNDKKINGVFDRNKSWFSLEQDENNKKAYRRKLLGAAKDFAQGIIDSAAGALGNKG